MGEKACTVGEGNPVLNTRCRKAEEVKTCSTRGTHETKLVLLFPEPWQIVNVPMEVSTISTSAERLIIGYNVGDEVFPAGTEYRCCGFSLGPT